MRRLHSAQLCLWCDIVVPEAIVLLFRRRPDHVLFGLTAGHQPTVCVQQQLFLKNEKEASFVRKNSHEATKQRNQTNRQIAHYNHFVGSFVGFVGGGAAPTSATSSILASVDGGGGLIHSFGKQQTTRNMRERERQPKRKTKRNERERERKKRKQQT
jgi:hypothetical protein